jgi:kynurenine formamidase
MTSTTTATRLAALRKPTTGRLYDLSSGWFRGMPGHPAHPNFDVVTYRTPRGEQLHGDLALTSENNTTGFGFITELIIGTMHTGTHVDAPCHTVVDGESHGGTKIEDSLGDFGTLDAEADASALPHMINRGVLLDVPTAVGYETLPNHFPVGPDELARTCEQQGTEVTPNTIVLIRTGQMAFWPDAEEMQQCHDAGVTLAGAHWLVEHGAVGVGADTPAIEVAPSGIDGSPQPVHVFLIREHGLPILEWVYLEEIARAGEHEFLFLGLPLRVRGATGSMLAPAAII